MSDDDVLRKDSRSAGYRISCAASRLIKGLQMYAPCPSSQRDYSAHHYRVGLFAVVCNSFGDDVSGRQCHRLNGLVGRARANPWRVNFCKRCLRPPSSPPKYRVCQREEGEEEEERVGPIPLPSLLRLPMVQRITLPSSSLAPMQAPLTCTVRVIRRYKWQQRGKVEVVACTVHCCCRVCIAHSKAC